MGSPAVVRSPRTGSATICAACLPSAHPPVPNDRWPPACAAAANDPLCPPGDPPPLPAGSVTDGRRLRNQSDVAALAALAAPAEPAEPAALAARAGSRGPTVPAGLAGRAGL